MNNRFIKFIAAVFCVGTIASCKSCNSNKPDISNVDVKLNVLRLEQDMPALNRNYDSAYAVLNNRYGDFLPFYLKMVAQVIRANDTSITRDSFLHYINDPYVKALRDTALQRYNNIDDIKRDLTKAFRYYRFYFPKAPVPTVVTYVDGPPYGFNYNLDYLGIGLDGYFGPQSIFYSAMADPIPAFAIRKFQRPYIVPNSMNVWAGALYDFDINGHKLIDAMVYKGKVYYFMKKVLPDTPDSLIFGYADSTLTWLGQNESEVWHFFIKNDLLYNSDPLAFSKYVNDGPNTSGMPDQAPGNIGSWLGYRIVAKYMERHPEISLPQLMNENDAQKILTESRYKP